MTDVEQVRMVLARYWQFLDDRRGHDWVELFADDATLEYEGTVARSRSDLDAIAADLPNHTGGKHVSSNEIIETDGDRATARSDVVFLAPDPDGKVTIHFYGRCDDVLQRRGPDSPWRFTSRLIMFQGGYHG